MIERRALGVFRHADRCARPRGPAVRHWRDRRARSWPSPARTCPWPKSAIRFRTTTRPWRRRGGRPTARPRCAGAGRSATASSDWPRQTRGSARPKRRCCRCAGSAIPRACGRPDPISRPAPGWRPPGFCLRTSSMTFSSASLSACEVEDVAATAAGATCLRGGGKAACWRVAGARTGGAGAGAAEPPQGPPPPGCARRARWSVPWTLERRCGRSAAASAVELLAWPRHPRGRPPARRPAPGSWPVRSIAMRLRGRKGSRLSSAAANHSIAQALGLFD